MRLIVGVDGTEQGMEALEEALERAAEADHELTVATFSRGGESVGSVEEAVTNRLAKRSVDADVERIEDDPAATLVELTELEEYDQLFLPGGHRSPLGKIKLDATLEFVLLNAQTTVTLVR